MARVPRRPVLLVSTVSLLPGAAGAFARAAVVPPPAEQLAEAVSALTAPEMDGRRSGTAGGDRAARLITDTLAAQGLRGGGDRGSFLQTFLLETSSRIGAASSLELSGPTPQRFERGRDWIPHGGSLGGEVAGDVVFVGYGADFPERGYDDYSGVDVRGKIALALDGAPPHLAGARVRVDMASDEVRSANVVGILPGTDPALADEAVVIGAHYDHLGRVDGVVYAGADDNASGTAVVLGLARAFAAAGGTGRTLVVALFGAEELGLIGSRHYVGWPVVPLARTVAMVNFDMVGRLQARRLSVSGGDSGSSLRALVSEAAQNEGIGTDLQGSPHSPSDHSRFYEAGVPVLFFHTSIHGDYHRPTDTADKIDAAGMARVAAVAVRVIERLATDARPVYAKVPPPTRRQGGAPDGAFLGIVALPRPGADGLRLASVLPGTAAAQAGLRDGDVIVRLGGTPVDGLEDLRSVVGARRPRG